MTKLLTELTEDGIRKLGEVRKNGQTLGIRERAHCILLSAEGFKTDETACIFGVDRRSVSSRTDSREESGFKGLPDSPRSGTDFGKPLKFSNPAVASQRTF